MKVYELRKQSSGGNSLHMTERPSLDLGAPAPGRILVKVRATSLNYRDLIMLEGRAGGDQTGLIPLSDGAGEVIAVGEGVTRFQPGDRVAGCFFQNWTSGKPNWQTAKSAMGGAMDGMLAEQVSLTEDGAVPIPGHLSYEEAACLPCAGLTAWNALVTRGRLQAGETVLVQGSGGVSIFALQFATHLGAKVIATSGSDQKLQRMRELGASLTINYKTTPEWQDEVLKLTNKQGVDHVVEVGGPAGLEKSIKCLSIGGHIAQIGVLAGYEGQINPLNLMFKNATLSGIYVGSRHDFIAMNEFLNQTQIHPVIDKVFDFDQAEEAYKHLKGGSHFGKVVIRVGES